MLYLCAFAGAVVVQYLGGFSCITRVTLSSVSFLCFGVLIHRLIDRDLLFQLGLRSGRNRLGSMVLDWALSFHDFSLSLCLYIRGLRLEFNTLAWFHYLTILTVFNVDGRLVTSF